MTSGVDQFLTATDLDHAAGLSAELYPPSVEATEAFRSAIKAWSSEQSVANLLMHPMLLPAELRVRSLTHALDGAQPYLRLAAAVGVVQLVEPLPDDERSSLVGALARLLVADRDHRASADQDPSDRLIASRAALALAALFQPEDAVVVMDLLDHPNERVRRSLVGAFVREFDGPGLDTLLADKSFLPRKRSQAIRESLRSDGVDLQSQDGGLSGAIGLEYLPNLVDWVS